MRRVALRRFGTFLYDMMVSPAPTAHSGRTLMYWAPAPPAKLQTAVRSCLRSNVCFYDRTQGFVQRVLPRPHVRLFLESVRAHFRLAVWSSRSRAWMSCALCTLDPAAEFLDFR